MSGPNFILDKGYMVTTSTTVTFGLACKFATTSLGDQNVTGDTVQNITTAGEPIQGVFQETIDATKVSTGQAAASVRLMGISRVVGDGSGTAIAPGTPCTVNASGQFVAVATAVGNKNVAGIAQSPCTTAGGVFDLLLTPYMTTNTATT